MTRINIGINPSELCDQHLVAEYRELLRAINHPPKGKPPVHFKLGKGHVTWCAQFPEYLTKRHQALVDEMLYRGFQANIYIDGEGTCEYWEDIWEQHARVLLIERINERLVTMKNPRWTKRNKPSWAKEAIHGH